jgi:hypothetical protein
MFDKGNGIGNEMFSKGVIYIMGFKTFLTNRPENITPDLQIQFSLKIPIQFPFPKSIDSLINSPGP